MEDKVIDNNGKGARRKYEKPLLITIDLVADEVLAISCKTPHAGGKYFNQCMGGGIGRPCFRGGS